MGDQNDLEALYRKSSKRHPSPQHIKRAFTQKLIQKQTPFSFWSHYRSWFPLASAALVIVCIVGVIQYNNAFQGYPTQAHTLIAIESHGFINEQSNFALYEQKRQFYLQAYLQKERSLDVVSTRYAIIQKAGDNWQLKDCNDALIQVSEVLISQLKTESRIGQDITEGSQVELAFNKDGLILFIEQDKTAICPT